MNITTNIILFYIIITSFYAAPPSPPPPPPVCMYVSGARAHEYKRIHVSYAHRTAHARLRVESGRTLRAWRKVRGM